MLKVEGYTQTETPKVVEFIRKVQFDAQPDREILSRSVLIKDDEDIVGMVSYESHDDMGIIRYFLYDACIAGTDIIVGMLFELYKKARECGMKQLITRIPSKEVGMLFEMLGFTTVTDNSLNLADAVYKDVEVMFINL